MGKDLKGRELGQGISQRKNGDYCGRYTDRYGKRRSIYRKKLGELRIALNEAINADKAGGLIKDITVDDWYKKWIHAIEHEVATGTLKNYQNIYTQHISSEIGMFRLNALTPLDIKMLMGKWQETYTSTTIRTYKSVMSYMFNSAVENRYMAFNPARKVKAKGKDTKEKVALTLQEQRLFLEYIRDDYYYNMVNVHFNTGLRPGELFGLTLADIDFERDELHINKTLNYYPNEDVKYRLESPKTPTSIRVVPMNSECKKSLQAQMEYRLKNDAKETDLFFVNRYQRPLHRNAYNDFLKSRVKKLQKDSVNIRLFSGHSIRHTFATRCFEKGIPPKAVQKMLGHSSIKVTMDIYTHVNTETLHDEVKKLVA